jgi:hypothetical protein
MSHYSVLMKADSCNRCQKIKFLMSSVLHSHYGMASAGSRPYSFCKNLKNNGIRGAADLNDEPKEVRFWRVSWAVFGFSGS